MIVKIKQKISKQSIIWAILGQFVIFIALLTCVHAQGAINLDQSISELKVMLERFATDRTTLERSYNIPMSSIKADRMQQFYTDWQNALKKIDFKKLSQDERIDYLLFSNLLQYELRRLDMDEQRISEISYCIPGWESIVMLEENRRKMKSIDAKQAAGILTKLAEQIRQAKEEIIFSLEVGTESKLVITKKTHAHRAAGVMDELQIILQRWFNFYNGYEPLFTWWVSEPYKDLSQALEDYAAFLRKEILGVIKEDNSGPVIGDPIGREALSSELANEMIPYSPEELLVIGYEEYDWCESEMIKASQELGYGDDWMKALEHVKTLHVAPGEQPMLIYNQANEAIEFIENKNLLNVPPLARETWRIEMMSPERQKVNPFFTGGEVISVSFPTNTMAFEQKLMSMRGNNIHFARATVHHELIPGHHLQGFMNSRYRTYRSIFRTPFWLEGWALYWEMLLWDNEFQQSAENKIGMLFWRMHRCARIIFSLSFHLEEMSAQECIEFLVDRVGHELDNATAEVRRSFETSYSPLYQCAYMLGGLQFRALHQELVQTGKMTNRAFHDAVLKGNSIPVEMVRASLVGQPLNKNFTSQWKFYRQNKQQ